MITLHQSEANIAVWPVAADLFMTILIATVLLQSFWLFQKLQTDLLFQKLRADLLFQKLQTDILFQKLQTDLLFQKLQTDILFHNSLRPLDHFPDNSLLDILKSGEIRRSQVSQ